MRHEWDAAKAWMRRPSSIAIVLAIAFFESMSLGAPIKIAFWAFQLDGRLRVYFDQTKLGELMVTPVQPAMLFPAILVRPLAVFTLISIVAIPLEILLILGWATVMDSVMGMYFSMFGIPSQPIPPMPFSQVLLGGVYSVLSVFPEYAGGLAIGTYAARAMLLRQGMMRAFVRGMWAFFVVGVVAWIAIGIGCAAIAFGSGGLGNFLESIPRGAQYAFAESTTLWMTAAVYAIGPGVAFLLFWLIYETEIAKLQSPWVLDRLRTGANLN